MKAKIYAFSRKDNVLFNPVYFQIEFGHSGFSCKKWIRRILKSMLQKFKAILIIQPRLLPLPQIARRASFLMCLVSFGDALVSVRPPYPAHFASFRSAPLILHPHTLLLHTPTRPSLILIRECTLPGGSSPLPRSAS